MAIENAPAAIQQIAQTTLRAVVGRHTLDETLSETETINQNIREILDVQTEEWGMQVTVVELRDIQLPDTMQRAMARQALAEREARLRQAVAVGEKRLRGGVDAAQLAAQHAQAERRVAERAGDINEIAGPGAAAQDRPAGADAAERGDG